MGRSVGGILVAGGRAVGGWGNDDPSRLGRDARDNLAGVHSLSDALRLAKSGPDEDESELSDVAEALGYAYAALERARARVPTAGVSAPTLAGDAT